MFTYTAASATPLMDGTGAVGTSAKYAREDHVHPSDTSRVPTTRTVNSKALSSNITLSAADVGAVPTTRSINGHALNNDLDLNASDVSAISSNDIHYAKYALSSIVFCAHCGDVYQRTHWNVHGRKKIVWRCVSRLHKKDRDFDCSARTVTEADLHAVVVAAVNEVCAKQELYIPQLKANIEKMLGDDNSGPVAELNRQIEELEQQILQRTRAKQDCDDLGQEVIRLREEKYQLQLEDATKESTRQKIAELERTIAEIGGEALEYEEALVRKLIERITVYDDYYTVEFKSGIEIDVRL